MSINNLDPDLASFLDSLPAPKPWNDIASAREEGFIATEEANLRCLGTTGVEVEDYSVPLPDANHPISVRVYRPTQPGNNQPLPCLLWMHGGGMIFCSIDDHTHLIANMAKRVGCCIVSVNYRLAPEYPYPTALEDCYAALAWVFNHAQSLTIDKHRVAVGGLSAGGNLAASLSLLARDREDYSLVFQLLLCPMLDPHSSTPAYQRITDKRLWNKGINQIAWDAYLNTIDPIPGYASPLMAMDLAGLPPAYILVGDQDAFLDENILYGQALIQADVPLEMHIIPGAFHGFEFAVPEAEISQQAWALHCCALANKLLGLPSFRETL